MFDQGQGDLFVVRVAGNTVGSGELASSEYAVEHLGVRLIMVLGHDQCGDVQAATENSDIHGPIGYLVREIAPAIALARTLQGNLLNNAIDANIRNSVNQLIEGSKALANRIADGDVRIIGVRYSLETDDAEILHTRG